MPGQGSPSCFYVNIFIICNDFLSRKKGESGINSEEEEAWVIDTEVCEDASVQCLASTSGGGGDQRGEGVVRPRCGSSQGGLAAGGS